MPEEKVEVENVNCPGRKTRVNARKHQAAETALLSILLRGPPGLTQKEMLQAMKTAVPEDLFPGGSTAGWWAKTVHLNLEAKKLLVREKTKPLRWHRVE